MSVTTGALMIGDFQDHHLPSEGIMAIYEQFRLIWRRQPTQASPHLPPLPQLLLPKSGPGSLILAMQEVQGSAAAAA